MIAQVGQNNQILYDVERDGAIKIVGAVYDIASAVVAFMGG